MIARSAWLFFLLLSAAFAARAFAAEDPLLVAPTEALTAEQQREKFHLPPGFEIQLVAAEPEVRKPMNLAFDAKGRLWVSQSTEYPFPAPADRTPKDTLRVYDQFTPGGRATRVRVFADELNIPIGVLPTAQGALSYAIPAIRRLVDSNGDGRADQREVLYREFGFRDTHGMASSFTPWIDGWVYACHGFANDSEVAGTDGRPVVMNSGNTYRFRADGSTIEYFTRGQVNPFGLAFDPLGNLYSADCHTLPIYQLLRGAWYPSFGKPHDGLGYGPQMMQHLHGSTGIAGVVYYAADHFPPEYRGTLFVGNPVTGRINHDRIRPHGSTYEAIEQPDFLRCDDPWFRPVDIKLGPDGALYVADFYNCIIGHYEVPLTHPRRDRERGRIWRIVYTGGGQAAPAPGPGDLSLAAAADLIDLLNDANLTVRVQATNELVERVGPSAAALASGVLEQSPSAVQRAHALWVVERVDGLNDAQIDRLLRDDDRLVRVHTLKALAERSDWSHSGLDLPTLVGERLRDDDAFVRRAAADALGRHPRATSVRPLLELWKRTAAEDTHLIHVTRIALRDHLLVPGMYEQVAELAAAQPDLGRRLADVSLGAHTAASAGFVLRILEQGWIRPGELETYVHHAARYAADEELERLYAFVRQAAGAHSPVELQAAVLRALDRAAKTRGDTLPESIIGWATTLAQSLLRSEKAERLRGGLELARELRLAGVGSELLQLARHCPAPELRPAAIEACAQVAPTEAAKVLGEIASQGDEAIEVREKAAAALTTISHDSARAQLRDLLLTAPARVAVVVAAGLAGSREGAAELLDAIAAGKASPALLNEAPVRQRLLASGLEDAQQRIEQLAGAADVNPRLLELVRQRRDGFLQAKADAARGRTVFEQRCAVCHKVEGRGAKIGPELDGIGNRGLERVLEDVLDPNRNVDQAFRAITVVTADGRVISGLKLRDEGQLLVLADSDGKELRISADEIESQTETLLSPMPSGVGEQIPEQEFYDLLAYLLTDRQQGQVR